MRRPLPLCLPVGPARWDHAAPVVSAGVVYFGDETGTQWAVELSSGAVPWSTKVAGGVIGSPAIAGTAGNLWEGVTTEESRVYETSMKAGRRSGRHSGAEGVGGLKLRGVLLVEHV